MQRNAAPERAVFQTHLDPLRGGDRRQQRGAQGKHRNQVARVHGRLLRRGFDD
jgi:hypothetical protein